MQYICDYSECTSIASQWCSRCKAAHYCCKDHQRAAWKQHKKMCKEVTPTKKEDMNLPPKQDGVDIVDMFEPLMKMIESKLPGGGSTIPTYHEEYRKSYPSDRAGYEKLKGHHTSHRSLVMLKMCPVKPVLLQNQFGSVQHQLMKRWQCWKIDLISVICRLQVGEVWKGHPGLIKPMMYVGERYQTMRNTPSDRLQLERGKAYVSVGFVDLQQVMEAKVLDSGEDAPVRWYGYEMNEISVARAMIVLDLINEDAPLCDILQIWYSSCISMEATKTLRDCCKRLEGRESDQRLKSLFAYWAVAKIGVNESHARWRQYTGPSQVKVITKLTTVADRVYYARYVLTGEFMMQHRSTNQGNVTFFCLPSAYENWQREEENMFYSFDVATMEYSDDLKTSVEKRFIGHLSRLIKNIKENRLMITVETQFMNANQQDVNRKIKELNPSMIEWSNIPDYFSFSDFFSMTEQCSGCKTSHTFHLMNWVAKVFGCDLVDFVDVKENYLTPNFNLFGGFNDRERKLERMMGQLEKEFSSLISGYNIPSFIQLDVDILNPMDVCEEVLSRNHIERFVEFMFEGRNVVQKSYKKTFYAIARCCTTLGITFSFDS